MRTSAALSVVGLGISLCLSVVHLSNDGVPLLCSATGPINCEQVTTSPESFVGPIPVAYLGVVWFLVALALSIGRTDRRNGLVRRGLLIWTTIGAAFALYLIYAELDLIGSICVWCTAVHILVFALFILAVSATDARPGETKDTRVDESQA